MQYWWVSVWIGCKGSDGHGLIVTEFGPDASGGVPNFECTAHPGAWDFVQKATGVDMMYWSLG